MSIFYDYLFRFLSFRLSLPAVRQSYCCVQSSSLIICLFSKIFIWIFYDF